MAKLYFNFGAMGCGKTRDLLKVWYNYKEKGKNAIIIKPVKDTKGNKKVVSRDNGELEVDYIMSENENIYTLIANEILNKNIDCILVDEAQFLQRHHVIELTDIVDTLKIPVICYGLRADFQDNLFPGSEALFIYADVLNEMKTICECGEGATRNVRFINNTPIFEGDQVAIDGEANITYKSMCRVCRKKLVRKIKNGENNGKIRKQE